MLIRSTLALVATALVLIGCEPPDGGGGGGVGGKLAFIRSGALVVSNDDGTGENTLTAPSTSAEPALSPTGASIAFAYSSDENITPRGIYAVNSSGSPVLDLVAQPNPGERFSSPTWSIDGASIVFVSAIGTDVSLKQVASAGGEPDTIASGLSNTKFPVFLDEDTLVVVQDREAQKLSLATGQMEPMGITTESRVAVEPGGKRVAYARQDANGSAIVVRDLETQEETALASTGDNDTAPAFSFDGSLVAFESGGLIYASPSDGTGGFTLLQSGQDVSWSP